MPEIHEFMNTDTPSGKTISFGLDEDGHLYVDGKQVITKQKISLDWWVNVAVILGALGAFAQGIIAIITLYK